MADEENEGIELEKDSNLSFEDALSRLEEIIHRMESGDSPLESLVKNYQSGVKLLKLCRSKIELADIHDLSLLAPVSALANLRLMADLLFT